MTISRHTPSEGVKSSAGAFEFFHVEVMIGKTGDLSKMRDAQHLGVPRQAFQPLSN